MSATHGKVAADRRATAAKWEDRRKAERAAEPVSGRRTHTPGPWRATTQTVTAPETEDRLPLDVRIYGGNKQDNAANARLIATAPDLLEALQQIIDMNVQYAVERYGSAAAAESMACVRTARAAIAKATASPIAPEAQKEIP